MKWIGIELILLVFVAKHPSSLCADNNQVIAQLLPIDLIHTDHHLIEADDFLTKQLKKLTKLTEGHIAGNKEYEGHMDEVERAITWEINRYFEKQTIHDSFKKYNHERLDLEDNIQLRLDMINELLPTAYPECVKFYSKQKRELLRALKRRNIDKAEALGSYSDVCLVYATKKP